MLTTNTPIRPTLSPFQPVRFGAGALPVLTDANFEETIAAAKVPVLVDFFTEWCGPCKLLVPVLETVAKEQGEKVAIYKLNIEQSTNIAAKYGITSIPTMLVFKNGKMVKRETGLRTKAFVEKMLQA